MQHLGLLFLLFAILVPTERVFASQTLEQEASSVVLQWGFVDFPPVIYQDEFGQVKGELAELMAKVSLKSGIRYQPLGFPNVRTIFNLNQQKINFTIAMTSIIDDRNKFVISTFPVSSVQLQIVWIGTTPAVKSITDLSGKSLILMSGYTYGGRRKQLEQLASDHLEVENHKRAIAALTLGRGQYALTYKAASVFDMSDSEKQSLNHVVVDDIDLHFILSKTVPQAENVMKRLESAFLDN